MLLEREEVNPDQADSKYGRTPILWAAMGGHEGIVKMLLERKEVNPHHADNSGRTATLWAAGGGHGWIVKMLLELEKVNPDQADTDYDRALLSPAAPRSNPGGAVIPLKRKR